MVLCTPSKPNFYCATTRPSHKNVFCLEGSEEWLLHQSSENSIQSIHDPTNEFSNQSDLTLVTPIPFVLVDESPCLLDDSESTCPT